MAELVIFTNNFPFGSGETFLEEEIGYLSKSFDRIHIFPLFYGNKKSSRTLPKNVTFSEPFIHFDIKRDKINYLLAGVFNLSPVAFAVKEFFQKRVFKNKKHFQNWLGATLMTRILLKKRNRKSIFDKISDNSVLYFYWGDKTSNIIPLIADRVQRPIVARFHGSDLYEEIKGGYIPFRKTLLKHLTTAVFISQMGEDYLKNRYPELNFETKLFRLGVPHKATAKPSDDNVLRIVSCSYVVPIKRLHLIVEILKQLDFKVEWTHLGGGNYLDKIKEMCQSLPENIQTTFVGQVSNAEVLNYYAQHFVDLFINVSESEGIPVSIMEAISAEIPVFATNVGGTSEIITDDFGELFPKDFSVIFFAERIKNYHQKSFEDKMLMRKNAYRFWSEHYNADDNYTAFANYLKTLV